MDHSFDDFVEYFVGELLIEEEVHGVNREARVEEGVVFPNFDLDVLGQHAVGYSELVFLVLELQDFLLYVLLLEVQVHCLGLGLQRVGGSRLAHRKI